MKAVILAAGKGKRLMPLTDFVAKPLLPIHRHPAIEKVIGQLKDAGLKDIIIVVGHLGEQVMEYLGNGTALGVDLTYVKQEKQLGMAHALERISDLLKGDFLLCSSDSIFPSPHIEELIALHREEKCSATLSLRHMPKEQITASSSVMLGEGGEILQIIEKPGVDEVLSEVSSSPLYVFSDGIKAYLPKVGKSKRGEHEIQDAIQMLIDDKKKVKGLFCETFMHLTDVRDLLRLNFDYTEELL